MIRTRQRLPEALVGSVLEKGYDSTSIQDITHRVGLRRATSYLHYRRKEELLLSMLRDTLDELLQKMEAQSSHAFTPETQRSADVLNLQHVQERADLYRAILSGQGAAAITRGVRDYLVLRIRENCTRQHPDLDLSMPIDVLANDLVAVKLNIVIWWLDSGIPYPPQVMAQMCSRLAMVGAAPVLEPFAFSEPFQPIGDPHE